MEKVRLGIPEDAPGIARVHVESWQSTYAGIVPQDYLDGLSRVKSAAAWRDRLAAPSSANVIVVMETPAREIIGFAYGGKNRGDATVFDGELNAIYLLKDFQRAGRGAALLRGFAGELYRQGYKSLQIWVLADNPARRFYESMGGVAGSAKTIEIGGAQLAEVSYGWPEIKTLVVQ